MSAAYCLGVYTAVGLGIMLLLCWLVGPASQWWRYPVLALAWPAVVVYIFCAGRDRR